MKKRAFILVVAVIIASVSFLYFLAHGISLENFKTNNNENNSQNSRTYVIVHANRSIIEGQDEHIEVRIVNPTNYKIDINVSNVPGQEPCVNTVPIGIVIYQGIYSYNNVSNATQLSIYPPVFCPELPKVVKEELLPNSSTMKVTLNDGITKVLNASLNLWIHGYYIHSKEWKFYPLIGGHHYTIEVFTPVSQPMFVYFYVSP